MKEPSRRGCWISSTRYFWIGDPSLPEHFSGKACHPVVRNDCRVAISDRQDTPGQGLGVGLEGKEGKESEADQKRFGSLPSCTAQ